MHYIKIPKYLDTQKVAVIILKLNYHRVMSPKDAGGMANSVNLDQTAPSSLIWVYTVFLDLPVRELKIITVNVFLKYNCTS